jgi:hypothetical protein
MPPKRAKGLAAKVKAQGEVDPPKESKTLQHDEHKLERKRGKRSPRTSTEASAAQTDPQTEAHAGANATSLRNQPLLDSLDTLREPPLKRGRRNAMKPGDAAYIAAVSITLESQL